MYLKIESDLVRKNIEIFKIILRRAAHSHQKGIKEKTAEQFEAFVHRSSGELRFVNLNEDSLDKKNWAFIVFTFAIPNPAEESFFVRITDKHSKHFSFSGFDPKAVQTLKETIKTIEFISRFLPKLQNLSSLLKEFSQMNLDTFLGKLSAKDLIHEAWHTVSREECESLLDGKPEGYFLFRKDLYAALLEQELSKAHKEPLQCITLSYLAAQNAVKDVTLVHKKTGWIIYDNDPSLPGVLYPSPRSLIETFKHIFKAPLLHGNLTPNTKKYYLTN